MSRTLLYDRLKQSPRLQEVLAAARERSREHRVQVAERAIDTLLTQEVPHFGAAELTLSRQGKDRGWAPEKQGSNRNVTISFELQHIIPESADLSNILIAGNADAVTTHELPSDDE